MASCMQDAEIRKFFEEDLLESENGSGTASSNGFKACAASSHVSES